MEQLEARRLRREEGKPLKEIARLLGVSRSSVSLWVRDVELMPAQHAAHRLRNPAYKGGKGRHAVEMSNSDPELIRLFGRFLRECFGVADEQMRVYCHA